MVPLDRRIRPHWRIIEGSRLSLWPSVDAVTERGRCHYVIRNGRTLWVPDGE